MEKLLSITMTLMIVAPVNQNSVFGNNTINYTAGGVMALFILGYVVYSLLKPDKF